MARHILIGGVDRFADYIGGSVKIETAISYIIDVAEFQIRGDEPAWGAEVRIEDDDLGLLFAGVIRNPEQQYGDPLITDRVWTCECDDFTSVLNYKQVTGRYEGFTATAIFLDLVSRYSTGFTVTNVGVCADIIDFIDFLDVPLAEALSTVAAYVGWHWYPDYERDLHFFNLTAGPAAPMTLEPGGDFHNFKKALDGAGVKNRITVRGGLGDSESPVTRSWIGDGTTKEWVLDLEPNRIDTLTVAGVAQVIGWDGLDEPADFDFLLNASGRSLKVASAGIPTAGQAIELSYWPKVPLVVTVNDTVSQAAMAAIFGGDGIIEHTMTDQSVVNLDQAISIGMAELRDWANPRLCVTFSTYTGGWKNGQIVTVALSDRGVDDTFLVQAVTITAPTSDHWKFDVTAGGTLFGLADFIADLATKQRNNIATDRMTLNKSLPLADTVALTDAVTAVSAAPENRVGYAVIGFSQVE